MTELVALRNQLAEDPDDARILMLIADACQLERIRIVAECTQRTEGLLYDGSEEAELQVARHNEICEAEIMLLEGLADEYAEACSRLFGLEPNELNMAATELHAELPKGVFNRIMDHVGATYQEVRR